jgi:YD repeat-containing protein
MPVYDDADRRTSVTYPNGNKIEYAYNAANELTSLTYTYDGAGNRIKVGGSFARSTIPPALSTVIYNVNN